MQTIYCKNEQQDSSDDLLKGSVFTSPSSASLSWVPPPFAPLLLLDAESTSLHKPSQCVRLWAARVCSMLFSVSWISDLNRKSVSVSNMPNNAPKTKHNLWIMIVKMIHVYEHYGTWWEEWMKEWIDGSMDRRMDEWLTDWKEKKDSDQINESDSPRVVEVCCNAHPMVCLCTNHI